MGRSADGPSFQNVVNYRYWRTRSLSESEPTTAAATSCCSKGRTVQAERLTKARTMLVEGLDGLDEVLSKYEDLITED
ncbi:MAG: hypothetical protein Ct9H300mP1_20940 [Planctomycetaceae bacterium]|nr:MAG: hypothetical protein Ct9H300mP1_20940 [Planctomycetaceae bacterium]